MQRPATNTWLVSGWRTPFLKVDQGFRHLDAIELSIPLVQHMLAELKGRPDFAVWGTVAPNLTWSNIAREVFMESGADASIPAFSTVMACSTSMIGTFEAASMLDNDARSLALVGGVESMSRIQIGLGQNLSDFLRQIQRARSVREKIRQLAQINLADIRLFVPSVSNRITGKSMGEHTEITAREWEIDRVSQDQVAYNSHMHAVAGWDQGFFDDLVMTVDGIARDNLPRKNTSLELLAKLPPAFDLESGHGTLTAGNSSPLTDGAAAIWVASDAGLDRLPTQRHRVRLVDWEIAAVDFRHQGLLMAPAYAVPRLLARHGLRYTDIGLWEIHEAFAAQVLFHIKAWEDQKFLREQVRVEPNFGEFPRERVNPHGGSVALGHPFGATGARILSQAVKELSQKPSGTRAIVSICADGGLGTVALLENP